MRALYYGDILQVLRDSIATESVDLIYLDSPFNFTLGLRFGSWRLTLPCALSILKGLDGGEQDPAVSQQDTQLFQIVLAQVRKSAEIDTVLHKRLGVLAKLQSFQPFPDVGSHYTPPPIVGDVSRLAFKVKQRSRLPVWVNNGSPA